MSVSTAGIDQLAINTMRTLSMDAVQQAKSGHPGTPMALAPVAYVLWNEFLRYDPRQPGWPARDRFVLSCGHASMLLYSVLHLAGVQAIDDTGRTLDVPSLTLDDLRRFRQLHSPCAGHPELGDAAGIETTTGPLGQGLGNSVGLAVAARWLSARYARRDFELFGFDVYAMCSDGDVMEGIGCEAASLAGHWKLSNLCWIYDDNRITIEGKTDLTFSEDVATRFEGLGWNAIRVEDANDLTAIRAALSQFQRTDDRPTIIIVRSVIAYGAPNKADTHGAHGAPLGEEEVQLTKEAYGWPEQEHFLVPEEVRTHFSENIGRRGGQLHSEWQQRFADYQSNYPDLAQQIGDMLSGRLPDKWDVHIPDFDSDPKGMATRVSSGKVLNAIARGLPWLIGGSADLAPATMTIIDDEQAGHFGAANYGGRNFHFGVREHAMAAICNGLSLAGIRPYAATFFVFSDYLRPAMRLSGIMRQGVIYVYTHDSIGLGEDGTTHQPVEHLAACRSIPRLIVARPADANEVAQIYRAVLPMRDRPTALVLTRQGVPTIDRNRFSSATGAARGAYVLADPPSGDPQVILIGTGSEVSLCIDAYEQLTEEGIGVRLVSMPSWELFDEQDAGYQESVLPGSITARVAVEAGIKQGWERYLGVRGRFLGLCGFGASAPYSDLYEHFGLTVDNVVVEAKAAIGQ